MSQARFKRSLPIRVKSAVLSKQHFLHMKKISPWRLNSCLSIHISNRIETKTSVQLTATKQRIVLWFHSTKCHIKRSLCFSTGLCVAMIFCWRKIKMWRSDRFLVKTRTFDPDSPKTVTPASFSQLLGIAVICSLELKWSEVVFLVNMLSFTVCPFRIIIYWLLLCSLHQGTATHVCFYVM